MNRAWTIAKIRGIPVRLHVTLLLFLPYVAFVASNIFHQRYADLARPLGLLHGPLVLPPLVWGVLLALALFLAILLHELAHCLVAISSGARVESITLLMLGGISRIVGDIRRPGREAWMAAAGPLTSLGLAIVFFVLAQLLGGLPPDVPIAALVFAEINLMLAIFNLLPAFPMDGGRILRAALTPRFGRLSATRKAAAVGKGMAVIFGILGLVSFNFVLLLIGVFVYLGASAETTSLEVQASLGGMRVRDLADRRMGQARADTPLSEVATRFLEDDLTSMRVGDGLSGPGAGFITVDDLERIDCRRGYRLAGDLARRDLPRVRANDDALAVLGLLQGSRGAIVVVDERGEPVGIVTGQDVRRAALLAHLLEDAKGRSA
jgi:Zn-dependent protease/CBS domain-containing protein